MSEADSRGIDSKQDIENTDGASHNLEKYKRQAIENPEKYKREVTKDAVRKNEWQAKYHIEVDNLGISTVDGTDETANKTYKACGDSNNRQETSYKRPRGVQRVSYSRRKSRRLKHKTTDVTNKANNKTREICVDSNNRDYWLRR